MAFRGEKFDLDLDDQTEKSKPTGVLIGDVVERSSKAPEPPTLKSGNSSSGWPQHRKRYQKKTSDIIDPEPTMKEPASFEEGQRNEIDAENKQRLAEMSPEEIEQERNELLSSLDPGLVEKLLGRSIKSPQSLENTGSATPSSMTSRGASRPTSSHSSRRVSFVIPDDDVDEVPLERKISATSHSLPSTSRINSTDDIPDYQLEQRPSNEGRRVSFAEPENESDGKPTASSHSIAAPVVSRISETSPIITPKESRPRASSSDRKVSFAVDSPRSKEEEEKKEKDGSTATSHSIALPSPRLSPTKSTSSSNPPSPKRPSASSSRKVSFADVEDTSLERVRSTASRHSLSSSPALAPIPDRAPSVHFPRPNIPDLDPSSDSFLDDLHDNYFPNLAHDPSKLDWMRGPQPFESSTYDPESELIAPKDIRFDFKGGIIAPSTAQIIPTTAGLHHHGDAPDSAGYTISELAHLSRSAFPAQKCMAMQTLGRILYRLGSGEFGDDKKGGQGVILSRGLWKEVQTGRVLDTIKGEASKEHGHRTSKAVAEEAVWNWMRGGGKGLEIEAT